jgi:hypothetical protein
VVEQRNQSIAGMVRCMLKSKQLLGYFWGEAVTVVVYILNHSPTCAIDGKTLYEAWHDTTPAMHYLCTFGCVTHVKVTRPDPMKLDNRSLKTIIIGYEPRTKAYRCYNPIGKCVIIFDKAVTWCWGNADSQQQSDGEPFTIKFNIELVRDFFLETPSLVPSPTPPPVGEPVALVAEIDEEDLDAKHDDTPLKLCAIDSIIGNAAPPILAHSVRR